MQPSWLEFPTYVERFSSFISPCSLFFFLIYAIGLRLNRQWYRVILDGRYWLFLKPDHPATLVVVGVQPHPDNRRAVGRDVDGGTESNAEREEHAALMQVICEGLHPE